MYKFDDSGKPLVFLVHSGGPFWKNKDDGAWSIPKGEAEGSDEKILETAKREFSEETGIDLSEVVGIYSYVGHVKNSSGKELYAYAFEKNFKGRIRCESYVEMEWPPNSGNKVSFPEVDDGSFFTLEEAKNKVHKYQRPLVDMLVKKLNYL